MSSFYNIWTLYNTTLYVNEWCKDQFARSLFIGKPSHQAEAAISGRSGNVSPWTRFSA